MITSTIMTRRDIFRLGSRAMVLAMALPAYAGASGKRPWLYSPDQLAAEQMVLAIERDPIVRALGAKLRAELVQSPRGKIPDAAATLDRAIAAWTRSLIVAECIHRPWAPFFMWGTDDTPRTWLGHTLGAVGISGDNPDAIYHTAAVEGGGRYEVFGRYHPDSRPTQFLMEVDSGDLARPQDVMPVAGGKHADIYSAATISNHELVVRSDNTFRITLGGAADGPNHLPLPDQGYAMIGVRDILGDWNQRPTQLSIRRLDRVPQHPWTIASVRTRVLADLEDYIGFWAHFPDIWFGGLKPNTISKATARQGGLGFNAGLRFSLAPDEAMIVNTTRGAADYTGFQIIDPWMIAPDARTRQVCLNNSQATADADSAFTYVISARDPHVANWLDTTGMRDGYAVLRWQAVPAELQGDSLIREIRVATLNDVSQLSGLARVTPAERSRRIGARASAYASRSL